MDFDFSEEQDSLRDAVARWVEKGFSFERRHGIAKAGGATREVWEELAGLGLTALAVPQAHGGMGFGAVEAMVVAEELGRGLVNAPWAQGAIVAPALLAAAPAALQAAWLPRVAEGTALVVLAHQERGARYQLNRVTTRAVRAGDGWTLTGTKSVVPAGDEADGPWVMPGGPAHPLPGYTPALLVDNPLDRYLINSPMLDGLVKDADGGITLEIRRDAPSGARDANWLPAPDGPFFLVMRLYWPKPEALDGSWSPPPVRVAG